MPRRGKDSQFHFDGFDSPNTTPVPDVVFDVLQAQLTEAELKALLYIIRRTFGFKKNYDPISFNQFLRGIQTRDGRQLDNGCGIRDRTTLSRALQSLEAMGVVVTHKGIDTRGENTTTIYSLKFKDTQRGVVGNSYHRGMEDPLPVVGKPYPQETVLQETEEQDIYLSNIREAPALKRKTEHDQTASEQDQPYRSRSSGNEATRSPDCTETPRTGPTTVGEVLAGRRVKQGSKSSTASQKAYPEDRQRILAYVRDFGVEFGDEAPLASSVTRAYNLYRKSGIPIEAFTSLMYEARALTQEYSTNIKKQKKPKEGQKNPFWGPDKNKMAYFFAVLEGIVMTRAEHPREEGQS